MSEKSPLEGRTILVVDDEPDVLESVGEILDVAIVHKAADYDTALQYLLGYTYDFVILDIMGVNGFELLRESVDRGFPTVMLTAHALTPEALKQSIKLGAVSFLPKEQMGELRTYLEEELEGKKQIWQRIYDKLVSHFNSRFGPGWREKDVFFKDFEEELKKG
ncbi:MAG: response regulator [Deltaproteobacteria bacterium HGW-Deltaproteobacteria-21]|nr:MAG: response regulator [Deltaproteobacteria bacterium HGW-Deltaproteobacteria-21]